MTLRLAEVLELDAVQRAAPEVVVGADLLDRPVRWVHTSELAEAALLLKGGELMLTTGLGIGGRGPVGEAAYVAALAEHGAAGLALELGWTYLEPPPALVQAARQYALPLIALREIVPFVEITEQVQSVLLERASSGSRRERDVRQQLTDALLDGAGPQELTSTLAGLLAAPVLLTTADGALVASAGVPERPSPRRARPVVRRDIVLLDRHWGQLAVLPPARADDPVAAAVCAYGAEAVGLALLRSAAVSDLDERRRRLVEDLAARRFRTTGELVGRARVLGLPFTAEGRYVSLVLSGWGVGDPDVVVRTVTGALAPGTALVADTGEDVVAVVRTSAAMTAARAVLAAVDLGSGGLGAGRSARVVAGPVVSRLEDVGRSLAQARRALELAGALGMEARCLSAAQMTAQLLLGGVRDEPLAQQLVREEIGRLVEHDRMHGTDLVGTLRTYLAAHSSKVRTAQALRLRRQTLYARLARIETLVGDVHAPSRHTALVLALALHDLTAASSARNAPTGAEQGR
ncbi:PucR family transcriptional regulator ligand-binding domain-containing protein [Pseudonocardia sp.]|uniref:PucR family transcriptional regulator n=1 Tax=Pseudonocardia sp. TaxID=60912 RepID=UPI0031FDD00A